MKASDRFPFFDDARRVHDASAFYDGKYCLLCFPIKLNAQVMLNKQIKCEKYFKQCNDY